MVAFAEVLKAVAWPIAAVWLGYLFRQDIRELLNRMTNIKFKEFQAAFAEELREAEQEIDKISIQERTSNPETSAISKLDSLYRIVDSSPRAAMIESWLLVEQASIKFNFNPLSSSDKRFPSEIVGLYFKTKELRNSVVHVPEHIITKEIARNYIKMAFSLAEFIEMFATKA